MAEGQRYDGHLRVRFTAIAVLLAIVPILAVAAFLSHRTYASLEHQSVALQQEVVTRVASELRSAITGREAELAQLDAVFGIGQASRSEQRDVLLSLLSSQRMYQELALLDAAGDEQMRFARDRVVLDSELRSRAEDEGYIVATRDKVTYFAPVVFDDVAREPVTTIAYPVLDRRTGEVDSVLVAKVRFKPIWNLLAEMNLPDGREVFLVSQAGQIVAHPNPAVVLAGTQFQTPEFDGRATGLSGEETVAATATVALGQQTLVVVAQQPLSSAFEVATRVRRVTLGVLLVALVAVVLAVLLGTRLFVRPVEELAAAAGKVAEGEFSLRVPVRSTDEMGALADAFNTMSGRLEAMVGSLERRVAERTADLEISATRQESLIAELEVKNAEMASVQSQLQDHIRSKDEFLGAVSHELRTPLTSVLGFAAMLRDRGFDMTEDERAEFLAFITTEGEDMADIVNDLLVAASADSAELVVDSTPIDIAVDIQKLLEHIPEVSTRVELSGEPPQAFADPVRVRQIVRNLLTNAGRYGGADVEIGIAGCSDSVVIQVRDNGAGLPEHEWETIFDPYQRSHHREGQPASVGLGLTVSRMLARRMDGELTYRYEGDRSVFELVLPTADRG
jgi:signal transduction histidine kinase